MKKRILAMFMAMVMAMSLLPMSALAAVQRPDDLTERLVIGILNDSRADDPNGKKIGYQYMDFIIEGNDILFLCRTAINDAATFHNSNYITFHRIENFRSL